MNILVKGAGMNAQPPKPVDESFVCAPTVISASFIGEEDLVMSWYDWIVELWTIFDRSKQIKPNDGGSAKISQTDLVMNIDLYQRWFPLKSYEAYRESTTEMGLSVTDFKQNLKWADYTWDQLLDFVFASLPVSEYQVELREVEEKRPAGRSTDPLTDSMKDINETS